MKVCLKFDKNGINRGVNHSKKGVRYFLTFWFFNWLFDFFLLLFDFLTFCWLFFDFFPSITLGRQKVTPNFFRNALRPWNATRPPTTEREFLTFLILFLTFRLTFLTFLLTFWLFWLFIWLFDFFLLFRKVYENFLSDLPLGLNCKLDENI